MPTKHISEKDLQDHALALFKEHPTDSKLQEWKSLEAFLRTLYVKDEVADNVIHVARAGAGGQGADLIFSLSDGSKIIREIEQARNVNNMTSNIPAGVVQVFRTDPPAAGRKIRQVIGIVGDQGRIKTLPNGQVVDLFEKEYMDYGYEKIIQNIPKEFQKQISKAGSEEKKTALQTAYQLFLKEGPPEIRVLDKDGTLLWSNFSM